METSEIYADFQNVPKTIDCPQKNLVQKNVSIQKFDKMLHALGLVFMQYYIFMQLIQHFLTIQEMNVELGFFLPLATFRKDKVYLFERDFFILRKNICKQLL